MLGEAEFWLKRGVDGFRVDAIDFALHDQDLRDNPTRPRTLGTSSGMAEESPYARQIHRYQKAHPDLPAKVLKPLSQLAARYDSAFLLGEISGDDTAERLAAYTGSGGLDAAYTFDLLTADRTPAGFRNVVEPVEQHIGGGWPCYSLGNHDVARPSSDTDTASLQPLLTAILCCLRGTVCLYQGEELGLTEADIPFEDLQDPFGLAFYPAFKGRDGCRTPMPWVGRGQQAAGFTDGKPWLPIPEEHRPRAADLQKADTNSVLNRTMTFLAWRKTQPALLRGDIKFPIAPDPILAIERILDDQHLLCLFNLSQDRQIFDCPYPVDPLDGHGFQSPPHLHPDHPPPHTLPSSGADAASVDLVLDRWSTADWLGFGFVWFFSELIDARYVRQSGANDIMNSQRNKRKGVATSPLFNSVAIFEYFFPFVDRNHRRQTSLIPQWKPVAIDHYCRLQ